MKRYKYMLHWYKSLGKSNTNNVMKNIMRRNEYFSIIPIYYVITVTWGDLRHILGYSGITSCDLPPNSWWAAKTRHSWSTNGAPRWITPTLATYQWLWSTCRRHLIGCTLIVSSPNFAKSRFLMDWLHWLTVF